MTGSLPSPQINVVELGESESQVEQDNNTETGGRGDFLNNLVGDCRSIRQIRLL